jgi:hypothetical protein
MGGTGNSSHDEEAAMDEVRFPITFNFPSGDVSQVFNPFSYTQTGGQFGLINVSLGQSSAPEVERDMVVRAGSYGKQIGRITEALDAVIGLLSKVDDEGRLDAKAIRAFKESDTFKDLKWLVDTMYQVKKDHGRP